MTKTSFHELDMYPYARKNLRKRYPKNEGWEILPQDEWLGYRPDFVVERRTRSGTIERAVVEVKLTCKASYRDVDQLDSYVRNLAGRNVRVVQKMLAVPAGSDVSFVPEDVTIMFLRSFQCEDDEIVLYTY